MPNRPEIQTPAPATAAQSAQQAPSDDIWIKCPQCKEIAFHKEVERNLNVCGKCGHHFRVTLLERLSITADRGSWREMFAEMAIGDPLNFIDSKPYPKRLQQSRDSSGRNDAVVVGSAKIEEHPVALAIMDWDFMGGSMGVVVGEKLAALFDYALAHQLPVVVFATSGGARMQEGALSLMQMAKVSSAVARLRDARLPYICVLCDPTTGGVAASFAMLGDLNIAEPGTLIGFAGRRVSGVDRTSREEIPDDFQRAEFLLAHGMLDAIVPRSQMRPALGRLLNMLHRPAPAKKGAARASKSRRRTAD